MTHLSDGSYSQRFVTSFAFLLLELFLIWDRDGFASFNLRTSSHRMKGLSTILLLTSQVLMLCYDGVSTFFKYDEGLSYVNYSILAKPATKYADPNKTLVEVANNLLNISWTLKSSALFLALASWNYAVCNMVNFKNFHKSFEFKSYVGYSLTSFVLYFIVARVFDNDVTLRTAAPQLVYHSECLVLSVIMVRTNRKFIDFCAGKVKDSVVERINGYIALNRLLISTILADGIALLIINIDIVGHPSVERTIFNDKLATDLLTAIFSAGFVLTYPLAVLNLHPNQKTKLKSAMGASKEEDDYNPRSSQHQSIHGKNNNSKPAQETGTEASSAPGVILPSPSEGVTAPAQNAVSNI
eukprot:TRINITY_DN80070_c0_g1_i1.p1 TRINITY_DN80070_c0_g1~~TRINITY_DN80070_c0_g1_i1.p1  ORF type:complete len:355 (-),score=73.19 TRINITY_DN80070_c0_g1_i1:49-1113(-)